MTDEELNDRFDAAFEASHGRQVWKPTMREDLNGWFKRRSRPVQLVLCLFGGWLAIWAIAVALFVFLAMGSYIFGDF